MHPIFSFIIILVVISAFSIFGGFKLVKFISDREAEDATKNLVHGTISIAGGIILAISAFLVFEPEGKTQVEVPESGAFRRNKEAKPEPSIQELKKDSQEKKAKEWGEVNSKSYEEIRDEENRRVQEKLKAAGK